MKRSLSSISVLIVAACFALTLSAQSAPIPVYAYSTANLPVVSSYGPSVIVWVADNRYDGYEVTVSGTDSEGKSFSMSQRVNASGMPWTLVGFPVNPQGQVQASATGFKYDRASTGTSVNR